MIECTVCKTNIDVDDDLAYELGWMYETKYDKWGGSNFTEWTCPHCSYMEIN